MTLDDIKSFHNCCRRVIAHAPSQSNQLSGYAVQYAQAGLRMDNFGYIDSQIPYILNNMKYWRSDEARAIRTELERIQKVLI